MKILCKIIWNLSEFLGINLGKLAPHIFGYIIGSNPIKKYIDTTYKKTCPNGHITTLDDDMKEKYCHCGEEYNCSMDTHCCCDDCKKNNVKMD